MKLQKSLLAGLLAGLLALGAVACEETTGEDPLTDDGGTPEEMTPTPTE